jgi:hypothetical protein
MDKLTKTKNITQWNIDTLLYFFPLTFNFIMTMMQIPARSLYVVIVVPIVFYSIHSSAAKCYGLSAGPLWASVVL